MSWLFGSRFIIAGLIILVIGGAVFSAGNRYGPNARKWRACLIETIRRNTAIDTANAIEEGRHRVEEAAREKADDEFERRAGNLQQCILNAETADALNLLRE